MTVKDLVEVIQTQGIQHDEGESILLIVNTPDGIYSSLIGMESVLKESLVNTLMAEKDTTELLISGVNAYHTALRQYFRSKNAESIKNRVKNLPFAKEGGKR